jgi:hypothetical protein
MMKTWLVAVALTVTCGSASALAQIRDTGGTILPSVNDRSNATQAPGYCQVVVTTAAANLAALLSAGLGGTCSAPAWSTWAYFRPATAGTSVVRCAADGTALTVSLGFPLDGLTDFPIPGGVQNSTPFSTLKCISTTGASVTVDIWWMG